MVEWEYGEPKPHEPPAGLLDARLTPTRDPNGAAAAALELLQGKTTAMPGRLRAPDVVLGCLAWLVRMFWLPAVICGLLLPAKCVQERRQNSRVGAPAAPPPAVATPATDSGPREGEIVLAGVLEETGAGGFWILADRFQVPGRRWRAIDPPRRKRIEGSPAMEVSLPDGLAGLRPGARVQVIGRDDGSGKALPARLVCQDDAGTEAGAGSGQ